MNLLVGVRDTDRAFDAFEEVLARVEKTGDDLTVAVIEGDNVDPATMADRVRTTLDRTGVEATLKRVEGDAGGELVEMANSGGFDRLVVDGGERTPTGKIRLDPTTEFVVLNAETSVTLAR